MDDKELLLTIMEIARIALADDAMREHLADELCLSDEAIATVEAEINQRLEGEVK